MQLSCLFQLCVDRHEIIASIDLQAVAGIVDNGNVGVIGDLGELIDQCAHRCLVEIFAFDDGEACRAERFRHQFGVVFRIW
ncbi:hypothetical protein D3C87_1936200 [compost metagenome]